MILIYIFLCLFPSFPEWLITPSMRGWISCTRSGSGVSRFLSSHPNNWKQDSHKFIKYMSNLIQRSAIVHIGKDKSARLTVAMWARAKGPQALPDLYRVYRKKGPHSSLNPFSLRLLLSRCFIKALEKVTVTIDNFKYTMQCQGKNAYSKTKMEINRFSTF